MGACGIGDDSVVVAYDDAGGVIAARLVWMLRALGRAAALLDGGPAAWGAAPTTEVPRVAPARFTAQPWPRELLVDLAEVADTTATVIDARDRVRFAGGPDPVDPRSGHVPGARNLPARENLDDDGRILPVPRLRARFAAVGITDATEVVSSCGSGVTACHNLLAMEHAGLGRGRLWPGSWSQWSRSDRPVEVGPDPAPPDERSA